MVVERIYIFHFKIDYILYRINGSIYEIPLKQKRSYGTDFALEEEKKLKTLYWILNKDLLLFVLWEYLPVLTDIINSYLSSVTD